MQKRPRLYLAASWSRLLELRGYAAELERVGCIITSRWLKQDPEIPFGMRSESKRFSLAVRDLADIRGSTALALFSGNGKNERGGRHFETGYAFSRGLRIYIVGERENVFHYHGIEMFPTFEELLEHVKG